MNFFSDSSPIILLGMHRSGTTLITKLLKEFGVYMGGVKEHNEESVFFLKLNEKILKYSKTSWNKPYNYGFDDSEKERIIFWLKKKLINDSNIKYRNDYKLNKHQAWGWKDPRNTLTIDIWKKIFPDSKVVHIYRHPIDVAASLMEREKRFTRNGYLKWYFNAVKNYLKLGIYVKRAKELENIRNGIKLWKYYVERAVNIKNPVFHIKFEDFLSNPKRETVKLLNYLDLKIDDNKLELVNSEIDSTRKYAFLQNNVLEEIIEDLKNEELFRELGYDRID